MPVPASRIRVLADRPVEPSRAFVLYWMTAARRLQWNFGLQRAVELATDVNRPLVILEALRCDYPWASDRLHAFVLQGMREHARALAGSRVLYYPYVEPTARHGGGLVHSLGQYACAIVTDWTPSFFGVRSRFSKLADHPFGKSRSHLNDAVRLEAVDSNGLIPVADHGRAFPTARGYRAFMQRTLREHLAHFPGERPLSTMSRLPAASIPNAIMARWPAAAQALLDAAPAALAALPIDHTVPPVATAGGHGAATKALRAFVDGKLAAYGEQHNDPDSGATSRLSAYLHFGHISAHEAFSAVMTHERWTTRRLGGRASGAREGWWGVSPSAEAFLDQLVVWRELAFNGATWTPGFEEYNTLPAWARATLQAHAADPRPHRYSLEQLDRAATHDDVWNAAQRQLVADGWFHGYMRMLWGKKILEWSREPAEALGVMEHLMNRYSLDGRDPVSYANFGWVLGRYDRPWFDRPIFGTVRYMTSESARRKLKMRAYLAKYAGNR